MANILFICLYMYMKRSLFLLNTQHKYQTFGSESLHALGHFRRTYIYIHPFLILSKRKLPRKVCLEIFSFAFLHVIIGGKYVCMHTLYALPSEHKIRFFAHCVCFLAPRKARWKVVFKSSATVRSVGVHCLVVSYFSVASAT